MDRGGAAAARRSASTASSAHPATAAAACRCRRDDEHSVCAAAAATSSPCCPRRLRASSPWASSAGAPRPRPRPRTCVTRSRRPAWTPRCAAAGAAAQNQQQQVAGPGSRLRRAGGRCSGLRDAAPDSVRGLFVGEGPQRRLFHRMKQHAAVAVPLSIPLVPVCLSLVCCWRALLCRCRPSPSARPPKHSQSHKPTHHHLHDYPSNLLFPSPSPPPNTHTHTGCRW